MSRPRFDEPLPPLPEKPAVSIVICNYNHAPFLDAAVTTALQQTYECQVVVVDDGSTDNSLQVLEPWKDYIRLVTKPNGGQRSAYNAGFEHCDGDIVVFLDADDLLEPSAVRQIVDAMQSGVSRVHYKLRLMNQSGSVSSTQIPRKLASGDLTHRLLTTGTLPPSAPGSGNAYRRSALERLMPIPVSDSDRNGADFFAIYGTSLLGRVAAIPHALGFYRIMDRPPTSPASAPLVFGNAARSQRRSEVVSHRISELRAWVYEWSEGHLQLPERLQDFGEVKSQFAQRVFKESYVDGLVQGSAELPNLVHSVLNQREFSWPEKVGLLGWAATVLVAPRSLGKPLARYVVDPSSR
jgi:glycosyltransferase involved in cell wall biosynthesis